MAGGGGGGRPDVSAKGSRGGFLKGSERPLRLDASANKIPHIPLCSIYLQGTGRE